MPGSAVIGKAKQVRMLILDVDGVLTDGGLHFANNGEEYKTFNSLDGQGMRMLLNCGLGIAVITGRNSSIVDRRMGDLGVEHIYQGYRDKRPAFDNLLREAGLKRSQIAYAGDDLPDLPILRQVGFAIAVQNAHSFVKQHCDWVTRRRGGRGAVREITDFILQSQALLEARHNAYLE